MERDLDWLLDDLVTRVAHITKAVILSQDGIALGASRTLEKGRRQGTLPPSQPDSSHWPGRRSDFGGGAVRQTIIEMEAGFLLVSAAGSGTCLAVLAGAEADLGLVAYEMAIMVKRTGEHIRRAPGASGRRLELMRCRPTTRGGEHAMLARGPAVCLDPWQDAARR